MYEMALKKAIEAMHRRGKSANVLDIGTGTGLLSMMAVRHGADSVTACEVGQGVTSTFCLVTLIDFIAKLCLEKMLSINRFV